MRKGFLLFVLLINCAISFSQTLFSFGKNNVSKEEFLKAYNKNKTEVSDKEKSLREYLDLYINFKLKVEAAKNAKIDTLPQFKYDILNFRNQIIEGYLNDENDINKLIDEAFTRSQRDIHVQHFVIDIAETDIKKLGEVIKQLFDTLQKDNNNYETIIKDISNHSNIKIKITDLGYLTAFSIPYEFENIIFSLKPGETSRYFSYKNKRHIFKNLDERKAMGKWKITQILLALPPNPDPTITKTTQQKADSIYQLLKGGEDFGQLAKQYSDDRFTYLNNGELPEFGCGKYDVSFENEVIKLKADGEISKPFLTSHGFHIVKRISQTLIPENKNDQIVFELKQKVLKDPRINVSKDKFAKKIIEKIGYKKNTNIKDQELFAYADSVSIYKNVENIKNFPISNKTIFSFSKKNITGADWLNFIKNNKNNPSLYKGESNDELLQQFIKAAAMDYYKETLENYNPQFAQQVQEFKEGNMLFEIMEQKVWNKAYSDSIALKKYYEENKSKYVWDKSADIIIFNCKDLKTAENVAEIISKSGYRKKLFEDNNIQVQTDSGRYELTQIPIDNPPSIIEGSITNPIENSIDGTVSFVKVLKIYPAGRQRFFEDARGMVINDFQNKIEKDWIADLKKKYPVKINEPTFIAILKE